MPLPGTIVLKREKEGMKFLLDGQDHILSAEAVPENLNLNGSLRFEGDIPPGKHTLEVNYRNKKLSIPLEIWVHRTTNVSITVDPDTGELKHTIK